MKERFYKTVRNTIQIFNRKERRDLAQNKILVKHDNGQLVVARGIIDVQGKFTDVEYEYTASCNVTCFEYTFVPCVFNCRYSRFF